MSQALIASPSQYFWVTIVSYDTGLTSQIQSSQLQYSRVFYPIRATQSDFSFTIQFPNRDQYSLFQAFLLGTYRNGVGNATDGIIRFYWPEQSIDYAGVVKQSPMGQRKFEYSPRKNYSMQLVRDSIYTTSGSFSSVTSWQDIYGEPIVPNVQDDPAVGDVLSSNPPAPPQTGNPALGGLLGTGGIANGPSSLGGLLGLP